MSNSDSDGMIEEEIKEEGYEIAANAELDQNMEF